MNSAKKMVAKFAGFLYSPQNSDICGFLMFVAKLVAEKRNKLGMIGDFKID